jgi:hypothetical protein
VGGVLLHEGWSGQALVVVVMLLMAASWDDEWPTAGSVFVP